MNKMHALRRFKPTKPFKACLDNTLYYYSNL